MGQSSSSSAERRATYTSLGSGSIRPSGSTHINRRSPIVNRRNSTLNEKSSPENASHHRYSSIGPVTPSAALRANHISDASPPPSPLVENLNYAMNVPLTGNSGVPGAYTSEISGTIPQILPQMDNSLDLGTEDALELLREYDTVFLVDDSGSMAGALWREAGQALAWVAQVASQYDDDGIDIYFLNSRERGNNLRVRFQYPPDGVSYPESFAKNGKQVEALFARVQPRGSTPTGSRLDRLLRNYLSVIERAQTEHNTSDPEVTGIKPINYIIITDGAPTDDPEGVIVAAAKRLDKGEFPLTQLGIQFVQIGSDPKATAALEALDDNLSGRYGIRDIVDTTPYKSRLDGETLVKILLGGINKRVDMCGGAVVFQ